MVGRMTEQAWSTSRPVDGTHKKTLAPPWDNH